MISAKKEVIFQREGVDKLYSLLKSFNIGCDFISVDSRAFFDVYDVKLSNGTRASKVGRVLPDIGMAMQSCSTPIGHPVMREGVYRISIQREEIRSPNLIDVVSLFDGKMASPAAIGTDSHGEPLFVDLNTLPNLLIGGVPGSGKSVLLHSIILSLLKSKSEIYLVDPKMVEFNSYENFSQVSRIENSVEGMLEIIDEIYDIMNSRFIRFKSKSARNLREYNDSVIAKKALAPIVLVVDEWADMVLQSNDIQKPLCAIAQKGRAAGISIVLATQRPSSKVISGLIKANFPGRIALKVASAVDSRVILDAKGAENLTDVGMGLFLDGRVSSPIMFRAPFIENVKDEIEKLSLNLEAHTRKKTSFWGGLFRSGS